MTTLFIERHYNIYCYLLNDPFPYSPVHVALNAEDFPTYLCDDCTFVLSDITPVTDPSSLYAPSRSLDMDSSIDVAGSMPADMCGFSIDELTRIAG